jgi:hypothetical protein
MMICERSSKISGDRKRILGFKVPFPLKPCLPFPDSPRPPPFPKEEKVEFSREFPKCFPPFEKGRTGGISGKAFSKSYNIRPLGKKVEGPTSFITTTVMESLEAQFEDRLFTIHPDVRTKGVLKQLGNILSLR